MPIVQIVDLKIRVVNNVDLMIKTLIFDFDGTIADTLITANNILRDLSTKYGYRKLTLKESKVMRDYTIQEIFKKSNISIYKLPLIVYDVKKELSKHIASLQTIKGMDKALHEIKKNGYQLAIVTSNNKQNVEIFLKKNNLEIFDIIYTGTTIFGKARVIQGLLKKYNINKQNVLYIGDEIRDVEATKKVKIPIIAVSWGLNSRKGLKRFSPQYIIDAPKDLIKVLRKVT